MKRMRVGGAGWLRLSLVASLGLMGASVGGAALGASPIDPMLQPTPLILKDGRIANVSVHVVPFASGRSELDAATADELASFSRRVGTDCFLTAQVIGHIASDEVGEDDTLNAHRLARSRADTVQASLIGSGLPAKSIASVWDWQFMVRDARATLWVFQLTRGEDCDGRPLGGNVVAEGPATLPGSAEGDRTIVSAVAPAERRAAPATTAQPERTAPAAARKPQTASTPPATAVAARPQEPQSPARSQATPRPTPKPASKKGGVLTDDDGTLVITFPTNSSYFPAGAAAQLRRLAADVDADGAPAQVLLQVAVSGSTQVVGANSADEAARYNRWIAERRLERVRSWLVDNVGEDKIAIRQEFQANDDTRRVVVRVEAAG